MAARAAKAARVVAALERHGPSRGAIRVRGTCRAPTATVAGRAVTAEVVAVAMAAVGLAAAAAGRAAALALVAAEGRKGCIPAG